MKKKIQLIIKNQKKPLFKHVKYIIYEYINLMKTFSIFILLIYWSIILLAPVLSKNIKQNSKDKLILPIKKPLI